MSCSLLLWMARRRSIHNFDGDNEGYILEKSDWNECALTCKSWSNATQQFKFMEFDLTDKKKNQSDTSAMAFMKFIQVLYLSFSPFEVQKNMGLLTSAFCNVEKLDWNDYADAYG